MSIRTHLPPRSLSLRTGGVTLYETGIHPLSFMEPSNFISAARQILGSKDESMQSTCLFGLCFFAGDPLVVNYDRKFIIVILKNSVAVLITRSLQGIS